MIPRLPFLRVPVSRLAELAWSAALNLHSKRSDQSIVQADGTSSYAEYLTERTGDHILESEKGFITWRYIGTTQVYIIDIFVKKKFRKENVATMLADYVCSIARNIGCSEALGTVVPSTKGSNESLRVLWGYGMKLHSADKDLIIMKKEI